MKGRLKTGKFGFQTTFCSIQCRKSIPMPLGIIHKLSTALLQTPTLR
ncbi:hypothetical protein MCC93_19520 [Morococcus cerebrosus]|uniref:Uncharacterized protein n=1 Tax=Morococcus cerebrosus TaxID=1056807 RepID=A0A0C1GMC7_9NEIS|nr:hypothetical protein MCC93_19520 [Morococcus cerebrosus]